MRERASWLPTNTKKKYSNGNFHTQQLNPLSREVYKIRILSDHYYNKILICQKITKKYICTQRFIFQGWHQSQLSCCHQPPCGSSRLGGSQPQGTLQPVNKCLEYYFVAFETLSNLKYVIIKCHGVQSELSVSYLKADQQMMRPSKPGMQYITSRSAKALLQNASNILFCYQ